MAASTDSRSKPRRLSRRLSGQLCRWLPLLALLPVVALAWLNLRWYQAEQLYTAVQQQIQRWRDTSDSPLAQGDWALARERMATALRYNPGRGEYWMLSADVLLWHPQVALPPVDPALDSLQQLDAMVAALAAREPQVQQSRATAMAQLRQATRVRPAWSHGWLVWAGQKAANFELDAEFTLALQQGQLHGRHLPESQAFALQLALDHRATMLADPTLRALALENLQTALAPESRAAPRALTMLEENDALADFCPLLQLQRITEAARSRCTQ